VIDYRWLRHACLASAASMLLTAGCTTTPRLYVDTADEPLECTTFAWLENADRPASIAEQRIRAEVMRTLAARGYLEVTSDPDCLVSGVIYTGTRPRSPVSVGLGAGRWGGSFGGSVGVSVPVGGGSRTVGNLAIDVIDVDRNAEVWRGTLEAAFATPEPTSEDIAGAVVKVLEAFPRRGAD
jgi:hypothetical protein